MRQVYILESVRYPVISTLDPCTICSSACASIKPTSLLMGRNTVLGSSRPTWHSRTKRLRCASRVISNTPRVAHFVSFPSTGGSWRFAPSSTPYAFTIVFGDKSKRRRAGGYDSTKCHLQGDHLQANRGRINF